MRLAVSPFPTVAGSRRLEAIGRGGAWVDLRPRILEPSLGRVKARAESGRLSGAVDRAARGRDDCGGRRSPPS